MKLDDDDMGAQLSQSTAPHLLLDRAHGSCGLDWWWFGVVVAAGIGLGMGTTEERQKGNKVGMSESAVAVGAATLIGALLSLLA